MNNWLIVLRVVQALNIIGVLSLACNAYTKRSSEHKALGPWILGLGMGVLFGTLLLGVPFFIAGYKALPDRRWIFLQLGLSLGVLLPLWLDPLLTFRYIFDRTRYTMPGRIFPVWGLIIAFAIAVWALLAKAT